MIQQLETTLRSGAVPQAPQFKPSSSTKAEQHHQKEGKKEKVVEKVEKKVEKVEGDPMGEARSKVQEEITKEFVALMASGTLHASEAAALATRRVMQRYGGATNVSAQ